MILIAQETGTTLCVVRTKLEANLVEDVLNVLYYSAWEVVCRDVAYLVGADIVVASTSLVPLVIGAAIRRFGNLGIPEVLGRTLNRGNSRLGVAMMVMVVVSPNGGGVSTRVFCSIFRSAHDPEPKVEQVEQKKTEKKLRSCHYFQCSSRSGFIQVVGE